MGAKAKDEDSQLIPKTHEGSQETATVTGQQTGSLEERDRLFGKHDSGTNHEETETLSRPITSAYERAWARRKEGVDGVVINSNSVCGSDHSVVYKDVKVQCCTAEKYVI